MTTVFLFTFFFQPLNDVTTEGVVLHGIDDVMMMLRSFLLNKLKTFQWIREIRFDKPAAALTSEIKTDILLKH